MDINRKLLIIDDPLEKETVDRIKTNDFFSKFLGKRLSGVKPILINHPGPILDVIDNNDKDLR